MIEDVIEHLNPKKGEFFIDCTLGGGGYTFKIAELVGDNGGVLSFDLDKLAIDNAKKIIKKNNIKNVILVNDNFKNLIVAVGKFYKSNKKFDGIVLDLGLSSAQLDDKNRGFSFKNDVELDMSFDNSKENKAMDIINYYSEKNIIDIFKKFGEERFSVNIAKKIIKERNNNKIKSTKQLMDIIENSISTKEKKIHKDKIAARIFQSLRIATNDELDNLKLILPQAVSLLKKGGKLIVVSYHSLEDRLVKNFFKKESTGCICPPDIPVCRCNHEIKLKIKYFKIKNTNCPKGKKQKFLKPKQKEKIKNKRSESAIMRVAIRV